MVSTQFRHHGSQSSANVGPADVIKTALHSISFISLAPEIAKDDIAEALAFLARIRVGDLRSITYDVRATTPIYIVSEQALNALDDALFGLPYSRFGSLEKLAFRIPQSAVSSELLELLQKGLPRAHKRGVLALEVVQETA